METIGIIGSAHRTACAVRESHSECESIGIIVIIYRKKMETMVSCGFLHRGTE